MFKKSQAKFMISIILCIAFCPIMYFTYKYNVLNSWNLKDFCILPTPIVTGLIFCLFLFLINDFRLTPVWIAAFGISGALGGLGYHIIEQPAMLEYYPLFPEFSLVLAAIVYLIITAVFITLKMRHNKNTFYKICPYICGLIYGVWGGFAAMSILGWFILQGEYNKANESLPIWGDFPFYIDAQLILGVCFLILFFVTLWFNIRIYKKTSKTIVNILFEILAPLITFIPSMLLYDVIYNDVIYNHLIHIF